MESKVCKVALLGAGTVGGGTYEILEKQKDELLHKVGSNVVISKIFVRNIEKYSKSFPVEKLTTNWDDILNDPEIKIVVEVMGGVEPAKTFMIDALKKGKHIVTANKELLALHGAELFALAQENNCDILFEAAVAGAIPIIRPMAQCILGNDVQEVMGIINGTSNFILTKMSEDNMEFDDALALATELGYAEADPTADIEGHDAGRKLALLATLAFHTNVTFDDVYMQGISKLSRKDVQYAHDLGYEVKLIGVAKNNPDGVEVHIHPMMIAKTHPLATVRDSFNAVFVKGDALGDAMFYGRGAGALPTGSAIVGDVLDIVRNIEFSCTGRVDYSPYKKLPLKSMDDTENCYCIRMDLEDEAGNLAVIADILGKNGVNIAMLMQKQADESAELILTTHSVVEKNMNVAMTQVAELKMVKKIASIIRVYE